MMSPLLIFVAGASFKFLKEDADATRRAVMKWWRKYHVKSRMGKALPREAKRQLEDLLASPPRITLDRAGVYPELLRSLQIWEAKPPEEGSSEQRIAKERLLSDMLSSGEYAERRKQGEELPFTNEDCMRARRWLFKRADGSIGRYQSLPAPWRYKELIWNPPSKTIIFMPGKTLPGAAAPATDRSTAKQDPDSLKISKDILLKLRTGLWFTTPNVPPTPEPSSAEEDPDDSMVSQTLLEELDAVADEASSAQQAETESGQPSLTQQDEPSSAQLPASSSTQHDEAGQAHQAESIAGPQAEAHQTGGAPRWLHSKLDDLWSFMGFW